MLTYVCEESTRVQEKSVFIVLKHKKKTLKIERKEFKRLSENQLCVVNVLYLHSKSTLIVSFVRTGC